MWNNSIYRISFYPPYTGEAIHYNVSTNDCSISIDLGNNQSESNYNIELILDGKAYTGEFTTNEI